MPKYEPTDEEMDSSYSEDTVAGAPDTPEVEKPESVDEENSESAEILISKGNLKEGDTVTFRVVKDFGDEVSLERVTAKPSESPSNDNMNETTANEISALDTEKA